MSFMSNSSEFPNLTRLERKEETMLLSWSDNHEFELSYKTLLYWCPCAKCSPSRDDENTASENDSETCVLLGFHFPLYDYMDLAPVIKYNIIESY